MLILTLLITVIMKICTLCLSDGHGGLELYALSCISFYAAEHLEHFNIVRQDTFLQQQLMENETSYLLEKSRCKPFPYKNAQQVAQWFEQQKPDIVHIHWGNDLPLAALAKKLSHHKPMLVYSRHMAITHHKHTIYHRWLYQEVDTLLTITQQLNSDAVKKLPLPQEKIITAYLGVDAPPTERINRKQFLNEHQLNPAIFTLVILGRIEKAKGQHLGIDAIATLKQQGIIIQLMIIGRAMQADYLQALKQQVKQRQLEKQICFVDFVNQPLALLPIFDALALTTTNETFGLTLIEAMRCGVAVIGSNAGGVPEIIDHEKTGLLFTPKDSNDLCCKIADYYHHPEKCAALALAGQQKADQQFTKEKHFAQLKMIYQQLL